MNRHVSNRGFTILEVMVALALMATTTTLMISNWAGLNEGRRRVIERQQAQALIAEIIERLGTLDWGALGSTGAPWSQGRFFDRAAGAAIGRPALQENAASAEDDINAQGLAVGSTGLHDLRIYIEYYHALDLDTTPGLIQPADADAAAFRTRFITLANRNASRINSSSPTSSVDTEAPIFIRVLASWATKDEILTDADANGIPDGLEDDDPRIGGDLPSDGLPSRPYVELFAARRK
jgi:prepilin-type N-terminal cleavage/methylation domain-containing protein